MLGRLLCWLGCHDLWGEDGERSPWLKVYCARCSRRFEWSCKYGDYIETTPQPPAGQED